MNIYISRENVLLILMALVAVWFLPRLIKGVVQAIQLQVITKGWVRVFLEVTIWGIVLVASVVYVLWGK